MSKEKVGFWSSLEPGERKGVIKGLSMFVAALTFSIGAESQEEPPVDHGAKVARVREWVPVSAELSTPQLQIPLMVQPKGAGNRSPEGIAKRLEDVARAEEFQHVLEVGQPHIMARVPVLKSEQ